MTTWLCKRISQQNCFRRASLTKTRPDKGEARRDQQAAQERQSLSLEVSKVDGVDRPKAPCLNGGYGDQRRTGTGEL